MSEDAERYSRLLSVMSNPIRLTLLFLLRKEGMMKLDDLLKGLAGVNKRSLKYHLKLLCASGIVLREEGDVFKLSREGAMLLDSLTEIFAKEEDKLSKKITIDYGIIKLSINPRQLPRILSEEYSISPLLAERLSKEIISEAYSKGQTDIPAIILLHKVIKSLEERGNLFMWASRRNIVLVSKRVIEDFLVSAKYGGIRGIVEASRHVGFFRWIISETDEKLRKLLKDGVILPNFSYSILTHKPESMKIKNIRDFDLLERILSKPLNHISGSLLIELDEKILKEEDGLRGKFFQILSSARYHSDIPGLTMGVVVSANFIEELEAASIRRFIEAASSFEKISPIVVFVKMDKKVNSLLVNFISLALYRKVPLVVIPPGSWELVDAFGRSVNFSPAANVSASFTLLLTKLIERRTAKVKEVSMKIEDIVASIMDSKIIEELPKEDRLIVFSLVDVKSFLEKTIGKEFTLQEALAYLENIFSFIKKEYSDVLISFVISDPYAFKLHVEDSYPIEKNSIFYASCLTGYFTDLDIRSRINYEEHFVKKTGISSILNLNFRGIIPKNKLHSLLQLIAKKSFPSPVSLITDFTTCSFCGAKTSELRKVCPACMHSGSTLNWLGRPVSRYENLKDVPLVISQSYLNSRRYYPIRDIR
ncbi:MAG: hypothetical protein DRJ47_05320 [Thermoprotei archaeon]|nr:MAG: hypothetical protein DRJ47_05320 [Thermoprotei archaeon]